MLLAFKLKILKVKTLQQPAVFSASHTAGCIYRRGQRAHVLLTPQAHASLVTLIFHSKHRIARPFISLPSLSLSLSLCRGSISSPHLLSLGFLSLFPGGHFGHPNPLIWGSHESTPGGSKHKSIQVGVLSFFARRFDGFYSPSPLERAVIFLFSLISFVVVFWWRLSSRSFWNREAAGSAGEFMPPSPQIHASHS